MALALRVYQQEAAYLKLSADTMKMAVQSVMLALSVKAFVASFLAVLGVPFEVMRSQVEMKALAENAFRSKAVKKCYNYYGATVSLTSL